MASPAKILVAMSPHADSSVELLSWATGVAARPNDTVIALHILVGKNEKKLDSMRQAKAYVISTLGEFTKLCQFQQVQLEAKVGQSSSVGKGLVEEAAALGATLLVVGGSRNRSQRTTLQTTKYCFNHAPEGCSVIAIGKSRQHLQGSDSESIPHEGFYQSSPRGLNKDYHIGKAFPSLHKLLISKIKRESSFRKIISSSSPTESPSKKPSPRSVLDGPQEKMQSVECFSLGNFGITESFLKPKVTQGVSQHIRTNIWCHLPVTKLSFPFFQSALEQSEKRREKCSKFEESLKLSWKCFNYEEISNATNNFHPDYLVGKGGYAEVYRGNLHDGQTIAVKRLAKDNRDENKENEFLTEIGIIGHVCHPNTSKLIGCCIENGLHLIFNFSPNGSLESALHDENCVLLDWPARYKIVIGVSRGLHYLHKCCKHRIIHRDIKSSNVLLGQDFEPQISDFGLAKWLPRQWTHLISPVEGTFGYLAPEYVMHGIVDEKTDVYAFGILLLELVTGRKPVDPSKQNLLQWSEPLIESGNIAALADPRLGGKYNIDQMKRLVLTASCCVRESSIWRPHTSEVLQLLTDGHHSKVAHSWRIQRYKDNEINDHLENIYPSFPTSPDFLEDE